MTKKTSIIRTDSAVSENGHAAVFSAEVMRSTASARMAGSALSLRSVFPEYRDIAEIRQEIESSPQMAAAFHSWPPARQQEFLDFCCGNRGIRILYDTYFKYVFDPSARPEELSRMISALLGLEVKVVQVLPNESQLGADYTLVIMDIIVETDDGSVINVEVQKIGYNFPGERAACYNADLLLRQYQRIRKEFSDYVSESPSDNDPDDDGRRKNEKFSYKLMRPVYTIVFMERSTRDFHQFPDDYIHTFAPVSDTGLKLNLLQNYLFVPLDIFKKHLAVLTAPVDGHSGKPMTEKEAWLAFLSSDDPRVILRLLDQFPDFFRPLYDRISTMCRNTKEMIRMFSEELSIMDKNTVMLMIEEQQETIQKQNSMLREKDESLREKDDKIRLLEEEIERLRKSAYGTIQ